MEKNDEQGSERNDEILRKKDEYLKIQLFGKLIIQLMLIEKLQLQPTRFLII